MASKRRKKGAPQIVPRFLKAAVTIGAIPALAAGCAKSARRQPPVVAYFAPPSPADATTPNVVQPVVAAYQNEIQPVVAAYALDAGPVQPPDAGPPIRPAVVAAYAHHGPAPVAVDAGVDAAPSTKKKPPRPVDAGPRIPPPVVAALVGPPPFNPPPAVVAAYVPRDPEPGLGSATPKKKPAPKKP
jgi:hypothetical protein